MLCQIHNKNGYTFRCLFNGKIMKFLSIFLFTIALISADEGTQNEDQGAFGHDLEDLVRRLSQQRMGTTQNLQASILPRVRLPLMRQRMDQPLEDDSLGSFLNFPNFQNTGAGTGSHSQASATASVKRPYGGNVEAQASAFASVNDVNNEEQQLGEDIGSSSKTPPTSKHPHTSTKPEQMVFKSSDKKDSTKGEPYAMEHKRIETVQIAEDSFSDIYFVAIVAGCCAVGIFGVISAGICFYKLQKSRKAAADVDYPAYGVTGPNKDVSSPNGDRKLAQSAQMYHYQHQKQQMIAVEKAGSTKNTSASDVDSEEENEEGDYTVYECPGLAPTGEMEVKNPLFHDDSTPVSPPVLTSKQDSNQSN